MANEVDVQNVKITFQRAIGRPIGDQEINDKFFQDAIANAARDPRSLNDWDTLLRRTPEGAQNGVKTAFRNVLGREPSAEEISSPWLSGKINDIQSGKLDAMSFQNSILNAPEAVNRFIDTTYRNELGRAPETESQYLQDVAKELQSGKLSRGNFEYTIANSLEARTRYVDQQVEKMQKARGILPSESSIDQTKKNELIAKLDAGTYTDPSRYSYGGINYSDNKLISKRGGVNSEISIITDSDKNRISADRVNQQLSQSPSGTNFNSLTGNP